MSKKQSGSYPASPKTTSRGWFEPVNSQPDFPAVERDLLARWEKTGVIKKYLTKNLKNKEKFSFLDGPITANNPMGVHHAWGRTYKDLWQRYKNMQGFAGRFRNGFDCQGLWVEVEVEKELQLKSKRDIENIVPGDAKASIAKFIDLCRARVLKFSKIQTEQSKRLGYFMDWDNSYFTMSDENNYLIWHFLAKCKELGLIYKGLDTVPWCPRCGTAISQHEILTEEYQETTHTAVTIKYPILGRTNEYLLVWTTTPWSLPADVSIAVNPKLIYSRVRLGKHLRGVNTPEGVHLGGEEIYYIAKDRIIPVLGSNVEVEEEVTGASLLNIEYKGPFDHLPAVDAIRQNNPRNFHRTIDGKEIVTSDEGTGLVHIAPACGHEDFQLGKENNLSLIHIIDEQAVFLPGFGGFSGKKASDPVPIIEYLKANGFLFKEEQYAHRYPLCWRCRSELFFRAVDEWYIKMDPVRDKIAGVAQKINWLPEWGLDRELDWLKNMSDWLISKKRYWGLALPIWECPECKWFTVISGRDELQAKAIEGFEQFSKHSPHKPWVDDVKIRCEQCGEVASRIPDVGNPWLDAGIVPFSTITDVSKKEVSYLGDKKYWSEWFPADFITESFPGQFKNWFYSLLCMATILEDINPMKTVLGFATLLGGDGRAMHKSWGNSIEFNEGADKIGVDVMRWMYAKQNPENNLIFGYDVADQTRRSFYLILWNIYNFFVTYATFDKWVPQVSRVARVPQANNVLDKWVLVRLAQTLKTTTDALDKFDAHSGALAIEKFVEDFSTWYIRRSRDRVGPASDSEDDKKSFYETTYFVLVTLSKILAPFLPFMSELIFMNLTKKESVHLEDWPELSEIEGKEQMLITDMEFVRQAAAAGHAARKGANIKVRQPLKKAIVGASVPSPSRSMLSLLEDELNVHEISWKKKRVTEVEISLTIRITKDLVEEGEARELVREIQDKRKKLGLGVTDQINVTVPKLPDKKLANWIKKKTLATELIKGGELKIEKV
ncbi:isoleucine--tRNA ligase [Candidatus Microgenomates bacterium]|nr:isoleucine--tRNA ligase [Candidatus Microgenomates bacterium]